MELALPAGLYGMAVAEPAALDRKLDGNFMYFVEIIRVLFMLSLNYLVTGLFLFQLWRMNEERAVAECSGRILLLELGCVFLFEVRMLVDVRKSLSIMSLLWAAPYPPPSQNNAGGSFGHRYISTRSNSPKAGAVLAKEPQEESMLSRMYRKVRGSSANAQWKLEGISRAYRIWCMMTVGVPALLLSIVLAYLGGIYIMRSADEGEMMTNTLAVVFVAEIEEFLYVAFTSDAMRYNLENMQPVDVGLTNRQRLASWFASSILYPVMTMCVAALVVRYTRRLDCQDEALSWQDIVSVAVQAAS